MHGQPEKRLQLLKKIKTAFERAREAHRVAEARVAAQAPPPEDATAEIEQLEGRETLALEDIDAEEEAALEQSSQNVADRYADRILAETDIVKRRALEREAKVVVAERRKGIEKPLAERRQGSGATSAVGNRPSACGWNSLPGRRLVSSCGDTRLGYPLTATIKCLGRSSRPSGHSRRVPIAVADL